MRLWPVTLGFWGLCLLLGAQLAGAKPRQLMVLIPMPQDKFPPKWTQTIHVSLADGDDSLSDHKYLTPKAKEFRAVLQGRIPNDACEIEVMCLSKGEKLISVFRQHVKIKRETTRLVLDKLRFVETIKAP